MVKLVLLVLFSTLCFVQPSLTDKTIIASSGKILNYENSLATFLCTKTNAIWRVNDVKITECNCPGKCGDVLFDETRITASCNGSSPALHFKQMKLDDNYKTLRCVKESSWNFRFLVGRKNDDFYPKKPFALVNNNYTLVCEKTKGQQVYLYDDKKYIGIIFYDNYIDNMDKENFVITSDQSKITLLIKKVALKDDGKIFGCYLQGNHLSLLNLRVNVPVSSVSLHQEGTDFLIEDDYKNFVCKVDESKPKASFQWILSENGFEREITQYIDSALELNGKLWQTNSVIRLKLKRSFKTIKCRARIQGTAWTNSTSLPLDVKYPPPERPVINVSNSQICVGEPIRIRCEWRGGHPAAFVKLTCLSQTKIKEDSVTITETVTREMSNYCRCEGKHLAKNSFTTYNLSIEYPPNQVVIHQTSYLKGKPSSLICDASGGSPDGYTYSWSPGNYLPQKEININLTQVSNQEFTCTVTYRKCGGDNLKSAPTKIIVEDYPIIKMANRIKVIENETMELKCITEGNPKPTNMWRIGNKIINSRLLRISFTRQNATGGIQCIAIAKSAKHGILETAKNISILVTYAPEITISYENSEIHCLANANPANITYKLVQKWGNMEKKTFNGNKMVFQNLTYQDSGEWTCRASNGVPTKTKKKYSEKSVEVKVNISAQFIGDETQQAIIGHEKIIKVCFYCHPEAEAVEWRSEHGKLSSDKFVSAKEGLFPFTGNCTSLTLDITEKSAKNYELIVTNKVGKQNFSVNLVIKESDDNILVIILASTIPTLIIIISGAIICFKYRSYSMKKTAAKNNRPLPSIPKLDIYESFYDTLEMQQKEDEPVKYVYENHEALQKGSFDKGSSFEEFFFEHLLGRFQGTYAEMGRVEIYLFSFSTDDNQELMYADFEFLEKDDNKNQKPVKKTKLWTPPLIFPK